MLQGRFFRRLLDLRTRYEHAPELPFAEALKAASIQALLEELKVEFRDRIYTPLVTLWVFLSQVLDPDPSCRQAVSRLLAHRLQHGLPPCRRWPEFVRQFKAGVAVPGRRNANSGCLQIDCCKPLLTACNN